VEALVTTQDGMTDGVQVAGTAGQAVRPGETTGAAGAALQDETAKRHPFLLLYPRPPVSIGRPES
jgi:hypothetical protein